MTQPTPRKPGPVVFATDEQGRAGLQLQRANQVGGATRESRSRVEIFEANPTGPRGAAVTRRVPSAPAPPPWWDGPALASGNFGFGSPPDDAFGFDSAPDDAFGTAAPDGSPAAPEGGPGGAFGFGSAPGDAFGFGSTPNDAFIFGGAPDGFGGVVAPATMVQPAARAVSEVSAGAGAGGVCAGSDVDAGPEGLGAVDEEPPSDIDEWYARWIASHPVVQIHVDRDGFVVDHDGFVEDELDGGWDEGAPFDIYERRAEYFAGLPAGDLGSGELDANGDECVPEDGAGSEGSSVVGGADSEVGAGSEGSSVVGVDGSEAGALLGAGGAGSEVGAGPDGSGVAVRGALVVVGAGGAGRCHRRTIARIAVYVSRLRRDTPTNRPTAGRCRLGGHVALGGACQHAV